MQRYLRLKESQFVIVKHTEYRIKESSIYLLKGIKQ